jgi:hypothetical protein
MALDKGFSMLQKQTRKPVMNTAPEQTETRKSIVTKPATKRLVSMRFDSVTQERIKQLAAEWGVTQTRVIERLIDEEWVRSGRK